MGFLPPPPSPAVVQALTDRRRKRQKGEQTEKQAGVPYATATELTELSKLETESREKTDALAADFQAQIEMLEDELRILKKELEIKKLRASNRS